MMLKGKSCNTILHKVFFFNIFTGTIEDSQHYREAQFITIWYLPINSERLAEADTVL
jgi:hypothetical protein